MEATKTILIDPEQARRILGVSRNRIYEDLLKKEDFPAFKIGSKYFINGELLQVWADKQCGKK
jgi:predicted DNA-binding transcriptional regulator AlpA